MVSFFAKFITLGVQNSNWVRYAVFDNVLKKNFLMVMMMVPKTSSFDRSLTFFSIILIFICSPEHSTKVLDIVKTF